MPFRRAKILLGTLTTTTLALFATGQEGPSRPVTLAIPLDFEVNGSSTGDITVEADRAMQSVSIDAAGVKSRLTSFSSPELDAIVAIVPDGFVSLEDLQQAGLDIALDLERLVITLNIEANRNIEGSERQSIRIGYQEPILRSERHIEEASISGYANFNARITQSENELGQQRDSINLAIDHAINFSGFALEGDSVWGSRSGTYGDRFRLNRLRLVKDLPGSMRRFSLGDISTPIKDPQRGFQLWGASIVKDFDIQPYRTFTPTSSASFRLDENAVVQMNMNGRPVRTLKLEPGLYDIEQFKLAAGLNTMDLEIVSESGTTEHIQVNSYGEPTLLNRGISTYAFSIGFPYSSEFDDSITLSNASWYRRHLSKEPIASGYFQSGLSENVTANISLQSSPSWTRIGSQATWASRMGILDLNAGVNAIHGSSESDLKFRLGWRRELFGFIYSVSGSVSTEGFEKTQRDTPAALSSIRDSFTMRVDKQIGERANLNLGYLRQSNHKNEIQYTASLNFGYKFPNFHSGLSISSFDRSLEKGISAFLTLTLSPRENWRTRTRVGTSNNSSTDRITTNWDYSSRTLRNSFNGNLNIRSGPSGKEYDGRFRIEGESYSATLSRSHLYRSLNGFESSGIQTSLSGEFALAFADGAFGLTKRISDSFAIIANHKAWRDVTLGINPTVDGYEKRSNPGLLKPVIADLRAYRESQATIRPIDGEAFLEKEEFHFLPSYRRGIKLTIGNEFVHSFRSTLLYWNEQPAGYKTLKVVGEDMPEILTFTNRSGKFVVTGLKPGTYKIKVAGIDEWAQFEVTGDEKLVFAEMVILSDPQDG